ncbi:MAG TPA: exostosin family protein, partial [Flavobacterium sp.]|nr:exostosin family protein [Flavobacterium sp.]
PFYLKTGWGNDSETKDRWGVAEDVIYTNELSEASLFLIPKPVNSYSKSELKDINTQCQKFNIKAFGYISGDLGEDLGHWENIVFLRVGGFKSQLSENNKALPFSLSDHFLKIYNRSEIFIREKTEFPVVGFCGHANLSFIKKIKENLKFLRENTKRFFKKPFRKDYEPCFASAFERAKLLQNFEKSNTVKTNFIYRKHYRAGATTEQEREKTTLEYYDNIKESDYVLCVRGAGNFSVRLYEALMVGRIPVFVNTDCLLPFEDIINWKNHVVWVEWKDRNKIAEILSEFHQKIGAEDFKKIQLENRKLWKETLSVSNMLDMITNREKPK